MKNTITKIITISLCLLSFSSLSQGIPKDSLTKVEFYIGNKLMKKTEYIYSEDKVNCIVVDYETNDIYHTKFLLNKDSTTVLTYYNSEFVDTSTYYFQNNKLVGKKTYLISELQRMFPVHMQSPEVTYTKYNSKQDITEILFIDYHMSDTFQTNIEYDYDNDRLITSRTYETYKGNNSSFMESYLQSANKPVVVDSFFYNGNFLTRQVKYRDNIVSQEILYVRDPDGQIIERKTKTGKNFSLTQSYEYKQKKGGRIKLVRNIIDAKPTNELSKYVYNKNDQLLKYIHMRENVVQGKTVYKYDKENRITELQEYGGNGKKLELYSKKVYTYL